MVGTPHIELDSPSPQAVDGRQIRAVAFQDVRLQYVTSVLDKLGLTAAGRQALLVGSGRGLLARGLAGMGFEVVAVDPSTTATEMERRRNPRRSATRGDADASFTRPLPPRIWAWAKPHSTSPTTRTRSKSPRTSTR